MRLKPSQAGLKRKAEDLESTPPQELRFKAVRICRPKVTLGSKPKSTSVMLEHDTSLSNQYNFLSEKFNHDIRLSLKEILDLNSQIYQSSLELASVRKIYDGSVENSGLSEKNPLKNQLVEEISQVKKNLVFGEKLEENLKECKDAQMSLEDDKKIEELKMNHIKQRIEVVKAYNQQIVKQVELIKNQLNYKHETAKCMMKKCENEGELLKFDLLRIEALKKNIEIIAKSNKSK